VDFRSRSQDAGYNRVVLHTLDDGMRALDEAFELAKDIRVDLDAGYRRAIEIVEAMPRNQSGSDKSWVWRLEEAFRDHFARAKPA
jgi:hypothetical protein